MTASHLEMLEMMFPEFEQKFHLACDFVECNGQVGVDVPDPIGMGRQAYDSVSRVMNEAMGGIIGFLDERAE
jgi:protein-tyrosine phosphatase/ribose 5-phosphate isomerase B